MPASPTNPARSVAMGSVVGFLVVMEFSSGLLQGWFGPLLSAIGEHFGASPAELNWVSTVYLLTTAVCVPVIAKLGDRYGHKRLLVIATALVAVGSIVVALAPNFTVLLVGRAIQAPLAAFLPLEFAIVRNRGGDQAGKAIGFLVGSLTIGASLGLLVSGMLGQILPVSAVLWVPAVLLTLCLPVVMLLVPETTVRVTGSIDWLGAALLGAGLLLLLTGVGNANNWGWGTPLTLTTLLGGILLLGIWAAVELRLTHPLVDLRMIVRAKIAVPLLIAVLFGAQLFGSQTPIAVFAQTPTKVGFGLGLSPLGSGILLVLSGVAMFVGASIGDRIASRIGHRYTLVAGGVLAAVSYLSLALAHSSPVIVGIWLLVGGLGNGLIVAVLPTVVVLRAPKDSVGIASALYNTSRTAAGAIAGAVFTLVMGLFAITVGTGDAARVISDETAYVAVWLICAGISLAVTVLSLTVGAVNPRTGLTEAPEPITADPAIGSPSTEVV